MRFPLKIGMPMRPPVIIAAGDSDGDETIVDSGPFTTRRHYWKGVVWLLIALGVQTGASLISEEVESFYSQFLFHYAVRWLSAANKFAKGVSVGEILFGLLVVWFSLWSLWYLRRSWRHETRFYNVFKVFFLQILWVMSILVPIFLALWGLNYQRMPLADTLGFDRLPTRAGELDSIGLQIVSGVNSNYDLARGSNERPSPPARDAIFKAVEQAFQTETMLGDASRGTFSDPKQLALSRLTSWAGVSGFYIAFTGEVTYNEGVPSFDLPMVIAHHKAHQRGFAREDEANFIGYVVCVNSTEPYVRYSGYLYGLKVLEVLSKGNVDRYNDFLSRVNEGPRGDLRQRSQFWEEVKSPTLSALSRRVFSAYLRANRVHGGVKSYDEDVPLIIGYYLKYPQRQLPSADQPPNAGAVSPEYQTAPTTAVRSPDAY